VGDHVNGFEFSGPEGPPKVGVLPDIFGREVGTRCLSPGVFGARPQISQRRSGIKSCGQSEEVYNSPEDTVDYWGELIRFCVQFGSGCIPFGGKGGYNFFFFFFFF